MIKPHKRIGLLGLIVFGGIVAGAASTAMGQERVSGPYTHQNLSIYFVHGPSQPGPVPLTLDEALAKRAVRVNETGDVNRLTLDNFGEDAVFVQAGTIVKGGNQDRVLVSSLLIPAGTLGMSVAVFCVEHGRWSGRGSEDASQFASARSLIPSLTARRVFVSPDFGSAERRDTGEVFQRQGAVWADVARIQESLSARIGETVAAPQSESSLQLALENRPLEEEIGAFRQVLSDLGEKEQNIVGYAFVVNGLIHSVDLYPSNALFRKMWPSLLSASVTEALAEGSVGALVPPPEPGQVAGFIAAGQAAAPSVVNLDGDARIITRQTSKVISLEAIPSPDGSWVHRSFLAR